MAIAPEQTGIGIHRHFTVAGQDPYDTVVWDRRDARISHYATGAVAFEQIGVEVPSTWSINATNILAQKYFRGTLGTTEREWSLRQVADRVVNTIAAWGRKDGYFLDDEEAQAFSDELKYAIIHQKAAFNSPVWFNIGVEGVPQQGSACFILSVDDSMDSILEWYKEEGTIFKGGSGAGVNLSRIRSSKEHLRGGGTASGPVSFMRGADASAGTIKSGGKTRRAAKMVILNVDHPDVEDFIWCKAIEERKARALRDAGFDMDLDGRDSHSIQYQNANNSIRVTDDFMTAVVDDADWDLKAVISGATIQTVRARDLFRQMAKAAWECADPGMQFDTTINTWHTAPNSGRINGSNPCSEYMHVDNSACNLASLNLLTFIEPDGPFDVAGFKAVTETVFTAQEIIVGNADYPTEAIAENSRRFRQLGIGYANLGALLMAQGLAYDSDGGRAWAGAITALLTGHAYATSARTAARMGPFAGFTENRDATLEVLRRHCDAANRIDEDLVPTELLSAAQQAWDAAVETANRSGVRNAQASVLAPTGCLTGGSLVATGRGLVRLTSLGDPEGPRWQDLDTWVATDDGPRQANHFFVNGLDRVVVVETTHGYRIQGTLKHRIKVVGLTGAWEWKPMADLVAGDSVPLALHQLVGGPQHVALPPLPELHWSAERHVRAPHRMTVELAELVGYVMGNGSLQSGGLQMTVSTGNDEVVERLGHLAKVLFGLEARVTTQSGCDEVHLDAVRLAMWWDACGFSKRRPIADHDERALDAYVPDAVLHANDPAVYGAFIRGLFEAGGDVEDGLPRLKTTSVPLVRDVQTMLLALGYPAALHVGERDSEGVREGAALGLLDPSTSGRWLDEIGFLSVRKNAAIELAGGADRTRPERDHDGAPGFFFDRIERAELAGEEFTYDLSVPDNVTYIANGFVSHNTIGLLMDCDTTGIEPDLGLVKMKKLVGGGTMSIVNQTVPRALTRLGYDAGQVSDILSYIDEHKSVLGAPHLSPDHHEVFACSMGDNTIHYRGHVRMMAAVQPFISGAISKTVNLPEEATVAEIEQLHIEAWQLGLKAVAIYRDNCKVAQPLATAKRTAVDPAVSEAEAHDAELAVKVAELEQALSRQTTVVVKQPVRERMPRRRRSSTFAFRVADCEGFVTVGEYVDGRPGEVFMKVAKQGSTLAGIMDAFAISVSLGLQHGVPLATYVKKYTSMRFEPAGMTDDPDLRIAQSLVDYIFRRLAVDYMSYADRLELGVLTSQERTQPTLPGVEEAATANHSVVDDRLDLDGHSGPSTRDDATLATGRWPGAGVAAANPANPLDRPHALMPDTGDAPYCYQCGVQMQRAGSCHACPSCGTTSGCS